MTRLKNSIFYISPLVDRSKIIKTVLLFFKYNSKMIIFGLRLLFNSGLVYFENLFIHHL